MRRLLALFFLAAAMLAASAGSVAEVQRELRVRRYYFGAVDGRESAETTAAIREFQKAKALDGTGRIDEDTLRALGLAATVPQSPDSRAQQLGRDWLARYWAACQSGEWAQEEAFYAQKLRYYSEGILTRAALGEQRRAYYAAWPRRRHVPLLSFTTWADGEGELWISARVRHEVENPAGQRRTSTEELLFQLRPREGAWRAYAITEAPLPVTKAPKGLP